MRSLITKKSILLMLLVYSLNPVYSQLSSKLEFSPSAGYQQENFEWSIAGNLKGQNPNILSELIWKDLRSIPLGIQVNWNVWNNFLIYADHSHAFIFSGAATDTDYKADNRSSPVFNASLRGDKGTTDRSIFALGYRWCANKKLCIIPYLGYSFHQQSLFLLDDAGLNTTYTADWRGPSGKLYAAFMISKAFALSTSVNYHQVNYNAEADWNLIPDFQHPVSFTHRAKGYGLEGEIFGNVKISQMLSFFAGPSFFKWTTGAGIDELYKSDGSIEKTKLNSVDRNGFAVKVGATIKILSPLDCGWNK